MLLTINFMVMAGRGIMVSGWHAEQRELDLQKGASIWVAFKLEDFEL